MAALNVGPTGNDFTSREVKKSSQNGSCSGQPSSSSVLSLRGLRLTQLPSLPRLRFLARLDLSHNRLTSLPDTWPAEASGQALPLLQELLVSHNRLVRVPAWFASLDGLRLLDLSHNRLRRYPRELLRLPCLTRLLLTGNPIPNMADYEGRGFEFACSRRPLTERQQQQSQPQADELSALYFKDNRNVSRAVRIDQQHVPSCEARFQESAVSAKVPDRVSVGAALTASKIFDKSISSTGLASTGVSKASIATVTASTASVTASTASVTASTASVTASTASVTEFTASVTASTASITASAACVTASTASVTASTGLATASVVASSNSLTAPKTQAERSSALPRRPPRLRDLLPPNCPAVELLAEMELADSAADISWTTQRAAEVNGDRCLVVVGRLAALLLTSLRDADSARLLFLSDNLGPRLRRAADLTLASPTARLLTPALALQLPLGVVARRRRDYVVCVGQVSPTGDASSSAINWRPLDADGVEVRVADGGLRLTVSATAAGGLLAPAAYCVLSAASTPEAVALVSSSQPAEAVLSGVPGRPRLIFPAGCVGASPCRAVLRCLYADPVAGDHQSSADCELAAPVVECLPHRRSFCRPVTLCLPLIHGRKIIDRFGLKPETDLVIWHSDTTGSQPPVWSRLDAPFSVVEPDGSGTEVELRVQLTRFCLIRAVWSRLAGAIRRAKLGAAAVYPRAASYRMRCAVYAQPAAGGAGFCLEVLLHRADRPAPDQPGGGRVCVGAALLDRPVPPGRLRVRLLSEQFEADAGAGEAAELVKTEADFVGQAFAKVFACRYRRLDVETADGGSGSGVFGRVLVEAGDCQSDEPLFDFTLVRPPPPPLPQPPAASRKRARPERRRRCHRHCCCGLRRQHRRRQRQRLRLARLCCCCFGDDVEEEELDDEDDDEVSTTSATTNTTVTTSSAATEKLAAPAKRRCRRDGNVESSDGSASAAPPAAAAAAATIRSVEARSRPGSPCPVEPDEFALWEAADFAAARWRVLARALRLSSAEVARIESRWGNDGREAAFQCLLRWFEAAELATCGAAGAALVRAGLRKAARRLCAAHRVSGAGENS